MIGIISLFLGKIEEKKKKKKKEKLRKQQKAPHIN